MKIVLPPLPDPGPIPPEPADPMDPLLVTSVATSLALAAALVADWDAAVTVFLTVLNLFGRPGRDHR